MAVALGQEATLVEVAEIVRRSRQARDDIARIAPEIDRTAQAQVGMDIAWQTGLHRLSLPPKYGGLSDGSLTFRLEDASTALVNIAAGDGSCGQMIGTQFLELRALYTAHGGDLSEEALETVAASFARGDTRLVASNAPKHVRISANVVAWLEEEVVAWIRSKMNQVSA